MAPRALATRGAVAAGLLLAGLACLGLWRVASGTEDLPFAKGAIAPASAQVTEAETYSLAVPGGVAAMMAHGVAGPSGGTLGLSCLWSVGGSATQALSVSPERVDTKAETTVAHFTAPVSGKLHVECANWGTMFIPDADDAPIDLSGWFLIAAVITLTVGGALALSAARSFYLESGRSADPGEDEQVEGLVHGTVGLGDDREVVNPDGGNVAP